MRPCLHISVRSHFRTTSDGPLLTLCFHQATLMSRWRPPRLLPTILCAQWPVVHSRFSAGPSFKTWAPTSREPSPWHGVAPSLVVLRRSSRLFVSSSTDMGPHFAVVRRTRPSPSTGARRRGRARHEPALRVFPCDIHSPSVCIEALHCMNHSLEARQRSGGRVRVRVRV